MLYPGKPMCLPPPCSGLKLMSRSELHLTCEILCKMSIDISSGNILFNVCSCRFLGLTLLLPGGHKVPAAQIILCSAVSSRDTELKLGDFSSNLIY